MAAKGTISSHLSSYFLLYLFVHQAHTGKIKKSFKNIHILGERVRRSNIEDGDSTQCIEVDKKNGFPPIVDGQFRVQFINNTGEYFVKVDWKKPIGRNGSVPKGYWFVWLVERYPFGDRKNPFASVCLSREKTSFLIDESESTHWRKNDMISIGVSYKMFSILAYTLKAYPRTHSVTQIQWNFTKGQLSEANTSHVSRHCY
ncbi:uncharacterized protein LOC124445419 [Xenia sp. Carnegie-2017]|uniref:uncharacterized protein LOC124445419 n=1 Tax=Xenia sp. Carnegie-2017 TaxID=2897299 RepID=UPI001F03B40B|nr:uncharacterized protein LOC124445419 [Xenia sp. Carnegie-2017]